MYGARLWRGVASPEESGRASITSQLRRMPSYAVQNFFNLEGGCTLPPAATRRLRRLASGRQSVRHIRARCAREGSTRIESRPECGLYSAYFSRDRAFLRDCRRRCVFCRVTERIRHSVTAAPRASHRGRFTLTRDRVRSPWPRSARPSPRIRPRSSRPAQ